MTGTLSQILKPILLVLSLVIICSADIIYCQEETGILAKAGSSEITVEEFKNRFEFMPHLNYSSENPDTIKKEFLYSLIAEKLWYLKSFEKRFDTLQSVKYSLESLRRLLIKDKLYRSEVELKIKISGEEISEGLQKASFEIFIKIISTKDSLEIFKISGNIIKGADFDSVLSTRKEYSLQSSPVRIVLGSLGDENVENIIFNMPVGSISQPVKSGEGWFIFKVLKKDENASVKNQGGQTRNSVIKILSDRKIQKTGGAYLDSLIGGKSIEADKQVFSSIFKSMYSVLLQEHQASSGDSLPYFTLSEKDVMKTIRSLNYPELSKPFIKFDDGNASASEFLYYLLYQKIEIEKLTKDQVNRALSTAVRQFIEDEMIVREGIKKGLGNSADVKKVIGIWREYYSAQLMMESFHRSAKVSDDELTEYIDSGTKRILSGDHKNLIRTQLELGKLQRILTDKTAEYAREYPILISEQLLESIELSELNTFVYKLIGFGGRIAAFPATTPMYEWYYQLKQTDKSLLP